MEKMDSFDRMVLDMSHAERMCLYDKLCASISAEDQTIASPLDPQENTSDLDIQTQMKSESVVVKFWLFLKSLFSGIDISHLYNDMVIGRIARQIEKTNPGLLLYKKGMVGGVFYEQVRSLKDVADFFKASIDLYEEDPGRFYVFLSSLVLPDYYSYIQREIDPFLLGDDKPPEPETRLSLIRRMEEVFQEITSAQRSSFYQTVINIDWLRQFVRLPFEKMLARFLPAAGGGYVAQLNLIRNDLAQFCRVLCNAKNVSTEVLQALCLFSSQSQIEQEKTDVDALTTEYVSRSINKIGVIKKFLRTIPIRKLACIAFKSATWTAAQPEGAEDWFIKYKAEWRKLFDARWAEWLKSKKRQIVEQKIFTMLRCMKLPELPYRPWEESWCELNFPKNQSMGFLYAFYDTIFDEISKMLKILVVDGDFKQRENRVEFVEAFNEFVHLATDVSAFVQKLSPTGEFGQFFENARTSEDHSIKMHSRLESALQSAYSEASGISMRFTKAVISITNVLMGVVSENRVGKYDSINNIAAIGGRQNQRFRQQLAEIHDTLNDAESCLKELELFENQ